MTPNDGIKLAKAAGNRGELFRMVNFNIAITVSTNSFGTRGAFTNKVTILLELFLRLMVH